MENTRFRRVVSFMLALAMAATAVTGAYAEEAESVADDTASAADTDVANTDATEEDLDSGIQDYKEYYAQYSAMRPDQETVIAGKDYSFVSTDANTSVEDFDGEASVLKWNSETGKVSYDVNIPADGAYNIEMIYEALEGKANEIEFALEIDGVSPYDTATRIALSKVWVNDPDKLEEDMTTFKQDFKGNDIRPGQIEKPMWQTKLLEDVDGLSNDPLIFYFTAGKHTLTFTASKAMLAIKQIRIFNQAQPAAYEAPSAQDLSATSDVETIRVEGEQAVYKSDRSLSPTSDRNSYLTSPSSPTKTKYNTIGAGNWSKATQTITWNFSVETSGYYKLGMRARQSTMRGFYSNRKLYIDNVVPNQESAQIKFYYDSEWTVVTPEDENGDPIYYYLEAGTHTITLEAIPGEIGELMSELDEIVLNVNDYYRQIVKITGPTPDKYTDYTIYTDIPTIVDDFAMYAKQLRDVKSKIEALSNSGGSEASTLDKLAMTLEKCVDDKFEIAQMLTQIKDDVTTMSSWMRQYREQPLEVDFIEFSAPEKSFTGVKKGFWSSLKFAFLAFIGTFFEDYNQISDVTGDQTMKVWVAAGRDQAQVVKQMVDSGYNPTSDTKAVISLVQGGVVEATLAGKGPDIVMFLGSDFPIQLAARGLLTDLSQYDDFDEVMTRFSQNAGVLYTYNGGVYGLPVAQVFPMLFYRSDILGDMGIDPQKELQTWDGLNAVLPKLMRDYMEVGLILPILTTVNGTSTVLNTTEAGNTFATLLVQQDSNFFNKDLTETTFGSQMAIDAFTTWTEYYTDYDFQQTYDAFTRFRTGQMPVLMQNYTFYNQLAVAAPEIKGAWGMMQVPGTLQEDGTINHSSTSQGSGAMVLQGCKYQEDAWEFIKWFTSTESQVQYANDIESLMGLMGRFETANIEALNSLSWSSDELELLTKQLKSQVEVPIIPASYAVTTNLMNAFRRVVNDADNPRDTLMWYNKDINDEIERKNKDLALYENE